MNNPNPFHSWLMRQRIWCERCPPLTKATQVRNVNGRDVVLCQEHAGRLDAARKSDTRQFSETREETPNLTT